MESLLGFDLDLWDYLTFLVLMLCVVALIVTWLFLAGLPGRIALARKHPEAEAVKYLGYAGLLPTVYPWMQALITGQRAYGSSFVATGPGGSSVSKTTSATAGPQGYGAQHTTTAYDARTGQSKSYTSSGFFGDHSGGSGFDNRFGGGGFRR